jgi:anti-anti-sigma factor
MATPERSSWLSVETRGNATVVRFANGPVILDAPRADEWAEQLHPLAEQLGQGRLVLDFAQVKYLTSTTLNVLIGLHKKVRAAGGQLSLRNVNGTVYEVFEVTRLTQLLHIQKGEANES